MKTRTPVSPIPLTRETRATVDRELSLFDAADQEARDLRERCRAGAEVFLVHTLKKKDELIAVENVTPNPKGLTYSFLPKPRGVRALVAPTMTPALDGPRIGSHRERVFALMRDGVWRSLSEICALTGGSEAGASARLRDFRKTEFGAHDVQRRRRGNPTSGLHEYRIEVRA